MKRPFLLLGFCFLLCSASQAADSPFTRGETLDFTLEWLGISAGTARMTIGPSSGDSSQLWITSIAETTSGFSHFFRVRDELESIVTRDDFSTVYYRKRLEEGKRTKDETTVVDPAHGIATRKGKTARVPKPVFDPISMIFYLRTLDLAVGRTYVFPVFADGKLYTLQADVARRERIETHLGSFDAFVVVPRSKVGGIFRDEDNKLTIWYSADARRLPLQLRSEVRFGAVTATLKRVRAGSVSDSK